MKIIWTSGKNLAFPDILSRNLSLKEINKQQLKHKRIPKEIKFFDENGKEIKFFIIHFDTEARSSNETPWQQFDANKIDYELHLQVKLKFLVFYNAKRLRHSELALLRNDCELERTQFSIIFMLAFQNTPLAGYMLTGDRSMFLDTDGSVAWLYQCPKIISPLKILDRCYDRIPIEYEGKTHFIDPITRKTFPFANEIPCQGTYGNMFHLNLDVATSWYKLSPAPEPVNKPLISEPTEIGHITEPEEYVLQRSGLYSPDQIKDFWDNVIHNSASATILKKLT